MTKKKPDIYEQEKQMKWDEYHRSPSVKELYSQVDSIEVEMNFNNPDGGGDPVAKKESYSQASKAFFKIDCPHVECVSGGFNLSSAISDLISSEKVRIEGGIVCQGWQDRERINKHRCLHELKYTIKRCCHDRIKTQ